MENKRVWIPRMEYETVWRPRMEYERVWKESANVDEIPSIDQFTTFFPKRCHKLENVEHTAALFSNSSQSGRSRNKSILIATNFLGNGCVVCNNSGHSTYSCGKFAKLSPQERIRNVKELALCLNCLKKGHQMRSCKSSCCRTCRSKLTPPGVNTDDSGKYTTLNPIALRSGSPSILVPSL